MVQTRLIFQAKCKIPEMDPKGGDMSKKRIGFGLVVLGAVMTVFFFGANALGIGHQPGIGRKQTIGACIGLFFIIVGMWLALGSREKTP
jgi:hypothetical protein